MRLCTVITSQSFARVAVKTPRAQVWSITGANASTHMRTRAKLHWFMCERLMPKMHRNRSVLKRNRPAVGCFHEWIGAGLEKHHLLTSKCCSADQQRGRTRQKKKKNNPSEIQKKVWFYYIPGLELAFAIVLFLQFCLRASFIFWFCDAQMIWPLVSGFCLSVMCFT